MTPLPPPEDLTSLVVRTDFRDDTAWVAVRAAIAEDEPYADATYVDDPTYAGLTVDALVALDAAAAADDQVGYAFLADATTMTGEQHLLLAVDLYDEPGRTFRVPPRWYHDVSANLSIANMDFEEFADATDRAGVFRGFK